jgi:hypothetical protein
MVKWLNGYKACLSDYPGVNDCLLSQAINCLTNFQIPGLASVSVFTC